MGANCFSVKDSDGGGEALSIGMEGRVGMCFDQSDEKRMRIGVKFDAWEYGESSEHGEATLIHRRDFPKLESITAPARENQHAKPCRACSMEACAVM